MDNRDRTFLRDFLYFTSKNHLVTAQGLLTGLAHLDEVTDIAAALLHPERLPEARQEVIREENEAVRTQRVLIAKIFAEKVAALEDLGAFALAIRDRKQPGKKGAPAKGIFRHYFESMDQEVRDFYDTLLNQFQPDQSLPSLDTLLNLPEPQELEGAISEELLTAIKYDYTQLSPHLFGVAEIYRRTFSPGTFGEVREDGILGWQNDVNILVHIGNTAPTKGILPAVYHKIKHRFMLTDLLPEYVNSDFPNQENIHYARLGMEEAVVASLIQEIAGLSQVMQELAALLFRLDEAGVVL